MSSLALLSFGCFVSAVVASGVYGLFRGVRDGLDGSPVTFRETRPLPERAIPIQIPVREARALRTEMRRRVR